VRYLFDWRDSIYFVPSDITETQSLDRVLSDLGLLYYNEVYYGRPSLVEKDGISYHVTKYYPNDQIARDGAINNGKKTGCWQYYNYDGEFLYEVDYFDTIIQLNDSIRFKSKGILTDFNAKGQKISQSYVIEKFEKYDCSHTDHYEIRQLYTFWQENDTVDRLNGYAKNYYDNGVLQNEGMMKDGLPTGVWKFYDPYGKLNMVGSYAQGKRDGRWLSGDLSKSKYIGDICLDPNLPNLDEEISRREKELEINIINYVLGKSVSYESYDWDLNEQNPLLEEDTYYRGYYSSDAF
jgi:antitoxin component YwqK of YwqJK toxin-antitoxin module